MLKRDGLVVDRIYTVNCNILSIDTFSNDCLLNIENASKSFSFHFVCHVSEGFNWINDMAGELHLHDCFGHDSFGNTFRNLEKYNGIWIAIETNITSIYRLYIAHTEHSFYVKIATILFSANLK